MSMDELVLAKLVEFARNPTRSEMEKAERANAEMRALINRLQHDLSVLRAKDRVADGPLTELWQAADALLKHPSGKTGSDARTRLRAALKAAWPFVDQIPF